MPIYELDPLLVVAPNLAASEAFVDSDAIRSAKPIDLAETLAGVVPGAALSRRGPLAGDLVLRGLTRDNVAFTVDGNKTYCACPNRMDPPAFHVSSQQIEAVSIRTGPFSVEQGSAIGGTIQVRTLSPAADPFARGSFYVGSFDYFAGGLSAGTGRIGDFSALAGAYYQQGDVYEDGSGTPFTRLPGTNFRPEYQQGTAFKALTAEAKATYTFGGDSSATATYGYQDASDVLYPGLRMDALTDTMHRASLAVSLPLHLRVADSVELAAAFSHVDHDMRDTFRTSRDNMAGRFSDRGFFMRTVAETSHVGLQTKAILQPHTDAHLRYGLAFQRRLWDADNLVGPNANSMIPDVRADALGLWGVYERRIEPWSLEAGARLDLAQTEARDSIAFLQNLRATSTNERTDLLPAAYILAHRSLPHGWSLYGGVGLASRQPDPQERYLNLDRPMANPNWIGNPDLDPVRTAELQTGLRWQGKSAGLRLNLFHAWLWDFIYLEDLPLEDFARATSYTNIDARLYGLSANAHWDATEFLRVEAGLAWQEGLKTSRPARASNDVLAEVPPLRARLAASLRFDRWSLGADLQLQDDLDRIDPDLNERPIGGWAIINLEASYRISQRFSLSGGIDNLLDTAYAVSNSFVRDPFSSGVVVREPGRFFYLRLAAGI